MKRKLPIILLIGLILTSVWQIADNISAQDRPLTLAQILTGLQTQGPTAETKTLAARNKFIAQRVRQRGVSFTLTKERENDLRDAGATNELIEAIRQNSPALPTPTRTPTSSGNTFKNSIGMEFVRIPSGSFLMGSPTSEKDRSDDEVQHRVTISKDFYMGKYEVTQGQWKAIMGSNPSNFKGDNLPVEIVSWEDAQEFIKKLNAKGEGRYRLPTEAEWEYAARAGTTTVFTFGDSLSSNQANFNGNFPYGNAAKGKYLERTSVVGSYQPNAWGLYDMHGNVWEWCQDWYGVYLSGSVTDPTGASSGSNRVVRGGGWDFNGGSLRSAYRYYNTPSFRHNSLGFRLIRE